MIGLTLHMPVIKAGSNIDDSVSFSGFECFTPTINHICYTFQHYLLKELQEMEKNDHKLSAQTHT